MKAKAKERYELGDSFGEPSHVLGLGPRRALALSRYRRRLALLEGGARRDIDLAALARDPPEAGIDLAGRGAPFPWRDGFAVAYRDVLHLWRTPGEAPVTLPVTIPRIEARRERGRLEPLLACAAGPESAVLALQAGAASVHSAHRLVRMDWDAHGARWDERDVYLDPRTVEGAEARAPEGDPHPPWLHAVATDGEHVLVHSTGPSRNHMRYGMPYSVLAWIDRDGATTRVVRLPDGYARFADARVLLEALHHKSGGMDFALLDRSGAPLGAFRVTNGAMAPVRNSWLVYDLCGGDLWLADGGGQVVRFELG